MKTNYTEPILDIEFNNQLMKETLSVFPEFEKALLEKNIIKAEVMANENILVDTDRLDERFWYTHHSDIRYFLQKHKKYSRYGSGVWNKMPDKNDVIDYFKKLIE